MRNNTKSLVRKLLVLVPGLVLLVGLFVGMSQMAFAQSSTTSASHFGSISADSTSPAQCPSGDVVIYSNSGMSCLMSGDYLPPNMNHVVYIDPSSHNVYVQWIGCDPQQETHAFTVHAGSVFSSHGHTYAGCPEYLGTVTILNVS